MAADGLTIGRFETVIVGGGQAGLATGYFLGRQGRSFVILDARDHVGDSWRNRWDSLRLFTPAKYDGLPGMRFPVPGLLFPTKDEVADYMAAYAKHFELPVRNGVRVDRIEHAGERFELTTSAGTFEAANVVVATGAYQTPKVPAFGPQLDARIRQMHSSEYRNPGQLQDGAVLVVGMGNSGAEISMDLRHGRHVFASGWPPGQLPVNHGPASALFVWPLIKFVGTYVLNTDTPVGRKALPKMKGAPLIRVKVKDVEAVGVERVPRVTGVSEGMPLLAGGRTIGVANVIWCTGFTSDLASWIKIPAAFGTTGKPVQHRGVAHAVPGLYFVGMERQYAATSDVLLGVGRDAAYVAERLAGRVDAKDRVVRRDPAELGVR